MIHNYNMKKKNKDIIESRVVLKKIINERYNELRFNDILSIFFRFFILIIALVLIVELIRNPISLLIIIGFITFLIVLYLIFRGLTR